MEIISSIQMNVICLRDFKPLLFVQRFRLRRSDALQSTGGERQRFRTYLLITFA